MQGGQPRLEREHRGRVAVRADVAQLRGDVLDRTALRAAFEGADVVVTGRVLTLAGEAPGDPLVFYRGRYRTTG